MTYDVGCTKVGLVLLIALGLCASAGCGGGTTGTTDSGARPDAGTDDAALEVDAAGGDDAGSVGDAATSDAGLPDTGPRPDAGMCVDLPPDPTRPVAVQCSACRPPGPGGGSGGTCVTDADCADAAMGSNGRCTFGRIGAFCDYDTCFGDTDCSVDEICLCDGGTGGGNVCVSAECHVDADCGPAFGCSPTLGSCGHYTGFVAYRCHRAGDACTTDADCTAPGYCAFDETAGHWACSTSECAG